MSTLKENRRQSSVAVREFFEDFKQACKDIVNAFLGEGIEEYGDMDLDKAVGIAVAETIEKNPEMSKDLNNVKEALTYEKEKRDKWAGELFKYELPETMKSGKDEDGYHKIEDKVTKHIKAEVSEEQARKDSVERSAKGRIQRTRVDED